MPKFTSRANIKKAKERKKARERERREGEQIEKEREREKGRTRGVRAGRRKKRAAREVNGAN